MNKPLPGAPVGYSFLHLVGLAIGISALCVLSLLPWLQPGHGTDIPRFFTFLGRFHPLILHLPIGWIMLAVLLEAQRLPLLRNLLPPVESSLKTFIIMLGATSSFVAVLLGWMLSYSGGYDADLLQRHFTAGLLTAIGANLSFISRLLPFPRAETIAYPILLIATAGALTLAGHLGASITHGSDYLTEYAPDSLRKLLGLPVVVPHEIPEEIDDRQAFVDVIKPVLATTCLSCHGPEKSKGGLRLDEYALLIKGGTDGPVVNASAPDASELLRRVNLPASDDKHMPPAGRPPLTADQIALLTWWIKEGAPEKQTLSELKTPPEIMHILSSQLPTPAGATATANPASAAADASETTDTGDKVVPVTSGPLPPLPKGIPGRLDAILASGPDLEYSAGYHFAEVNDAQFNKLAPVADHIIWLDLARSLVTDEGLQLLPKMTHLQKLELQDTKTSDAALESIASLNELEVLNLNGTQVTDAGLPQLATLKNLQHLYLYNTAVTDAGEKNLKSLLPQVEIIRQLPPAIAPASSKATAAAPAMATAKTPAVPPPGNETIWVDDALPAGAVANGFHETWNFVATDPAPYSGAKCWKTGIDAGIHQLVFLNAPSLGAARKMLYTYVYLDPAHLPAEVMLQWHDSTGSWGHRAYWGKDNLLKSYGVAVKVGELPQAGAWVRLEVPAVAVKLEGAALDGLAFSLYGGAAAFDLAGTTDLTAPLPPATQTSTLSPAKP